MSNDCSHVLQPAGTPHVDQQQNGLHFDRLPFGLAPDADHLFWTDTHRQVADTLRQGIEHASPVILITGETGTGKTTLVHDLLAEERSDVTTGLLPCVRGGRDGFCAWLLMAFGRQVPNEPASQFSSLQALLTAAHYANRHCVLVVDEAQDATDHELETLRLLTDLSCDGRTLLQVVLVGQPALRTRIGDARHASLAARIGADDHLSSMSADDTAGYIRHRLASAGGPTDAFTPGALAAVHRISQGIPRRTNLLCGLCLTEARRRTIPKIDAALVGSVGSAARQRGAFAGLFGGQEVSDAFGPFPHEATAALPPGMRSLLGQRVASEAREETTAGLADPVRSGPSDVSGSGVMGHGIKSASHDPPQRWPEAPPSRVKESGPIEPRRAHKPCRDDGPPSPAARFVDKPSSSPDVVPESGEEVRQLAFDAMVSLADYDFNPPRRPRRDISIEKAPRSRVGVARDEGRANGRNDADPGPAPLVRPRRRSGLGLATAAVASGLLGIGFYMAWSVHDALSTASGSNSVIAAAIPEGRLGTSSGPVAHRSGEETPSGGADGSAGRRAVLVPRLVLKTPALPTIATPEITAAGLFSLGLDLALVDRETAAIAFARAASRGHARAAYYLAQIYETGDGVPRNVALARVWYAASGLLRAEERLASLDDGVPASATSRPRLLSAARTSDGMLELVWTSAAEAGGVEYLIEVFDAVDRSIIHAMRTAQSSYRLAAPEGELLWRVIAETPATDLASDLQRIPSAI